MDGDEVACGEAAPAPKAMGHRLSVADEVGGGVAVCPDEVGEHCDTPPTETNFDLWTTDADRRFRDARDVMRFAEDGAVLAGQPRCESWHLDPDGRWICGSCGTVLDSLGEWADDPTRLVEAYVDGRTAGGSCTPTRLVVDERPTGGAPDGDVSTEIDVEQFLRLGRQLCVAGITLVDAVIFDDRHHRWSMCELLTGSPRWGKGVIPLVGEDAA